MNPFYKEPVVFFGGIIPTILTVAVFGVLFHFKGKLEESYRVKKQDYGAIQKIEQERQRLKKQVDVQAPHLDRWMTLLEKPTASSVNGFLASVQKRFGGEQFQQTAFRRNQSSAGIGGASAQPSIQIQVAFRGTYGALQNAFLELETTMPQLQLDSLKLKPNTNQKVLDADLVYTAWQVE